MRTISREFTKQLIEHAKKHIAQDVWLSNKFGETHNTPATVELARIALASLDAEPIYQCEFCHHDGNGELQWHWEDVNKDFYDQYDSERRGKRRIIYTTPPAPVVPEEMPKGLAGQIISLLAHNIGDKFLAQKIWNACRTAMLKGADGNSPVIPDGWVMVPVEPTEDMVVNGFESEPDESFSDVKEWEAYDAMSGCQQAAHRAKLCYAAMIAAAPKP
ncbi:hypothetical protein QLG09_17200 [Enterobacter sp. V89_11]|uniref:hypothetical protein n=1 Tax=Enterobacter sp. V89_11 TaxID=3044237 RepID=UPI00249F35F6|nr:hypothetical protein [Enterobacter sp. V89_11]MDI3450582.1 hypothetical protein [Enterobacter sp. V89_11]